MQLRENAATPPRVILVMEKCVIEPLGVEHLASLAETLGWRADVILYENRDDVFDFEPLYAAIRKTKPSLVGFSIWTGSHLQCFEAADRIRKELGVRVAIGGPHATYFPEQCAAHADVVAKGNGFRLFRHILTGETLEGIREISPGIIFDSSKNAEFPISCRGREIVYARYPELAGDRPAKIYSMMGSTGCVFHCSYCNSPFLNELYGGFKNVFITRPIDDLINEAQWIRDHHGADTIYFQDDIFGYRLDWLKEFSSRWKSEVGVPWHCQIRLELTQGHNGDERLRLFTEGGCTGITLAIESGNDFLREFVLFRPMEYNLIIEGCRKIMSYGLTLRTEQILQIPFSNLETDLGTLRLNCDIGPTMAWSSILVPFGETNMGKIAKAFGFYHGTNDDITPRFYRDGSKLRHSETARESIEEVSRRLKRELKLGRFESPLLQMNAVQNGDPFSADVLHSGSRVSKIQYMDDTANARYCEQAFRLQRFFNWFPRVPEGHQLAAKWTELRETEASFEKLCELTAEHLVQNGHSDALRRWRQRFVNCFEGGLPPQLEKTWLYFAFFRSGPEFAKRVLEQGILDLGRGTCLDALGKVARHRIFDWELYKVHQSEEPIALK
ncbi:MAG: cobalamin-dependent protein [Patescibacteria group bacterium]|nr:cobalamin-dependent protein [Patescibacteria group bacterium]